MTPGRRFVIVGAGGHAKVVIAAIDACGDEVVHLLDDDPATWGKSVLGRTVKGAVAGDLVPREAMVVIALGANAARRAVAERLQARFGVVVHPAAVVHPSVSLGEGTVVFAGAVVQPDTRVGAHCIINTSASVDHDCEIGPFVHISPGGIVAGRVSIGEGTLIGVGAAVSSGISIGARTVVSAGETVVGTVGDGLQVGGNPARILDVARTVTS